MPRFGLKPERGIFTEPQGEKSNCKPNSSMTRPTDFANKALSGALRARRSLELTQSRARARGEGVTPAARHAVSRIATEKNPGIKLHQNSKHI